MAGELLHAIEDSDTVRASNCLSEELDKGIAPLGNTLITLSCGAAGAEPEDIYF